LKKKENFLHWAQAKGSSVQTKIAAAQVPGFNRLYLDYLENFDRLAELYAVDYRASAALLAHADRLVQRDYSRAALAKILRRQNEQYQAGKKTFQAIELFQRPETVAVVTGQQTGLFGGPLLTLYKLLTAAKLAERLQARRGKPVVTIFWLATDDDDLPEADRCGVLDRNQDFHMIAAGFSAWPRRPFSEIVFDGSIDACRARLGEMLPDSEFKTALLEKLAQSFRNGARLVEAFASWLQELVAEFGVIFIDPADPEIKRLAAPVMAKEISDRSPSTVAALTAIAHLEKLGYSPQVPLRSGRLNLFYIDGGSTTRSNTMNESEWRQRHALEFSNAEFRTTDDMLKFSQRELLAVLEQMPERFAPNVILRPVIQDYLLPTVAYIGGPAEVAYFAEYRGVYEVFDVPMPAIYPRKSLTLLEKRVERTMEKYDLSILDLWKSIEPKINELAKKEAADGLFEPISAVRDELTRELQTLRGRVTKLDPTLEGFIDSTAGKILHQLDGLDKKLTQAVKRQNETLTSQLHKASAAVYPNGHLQERGLSLLPFLNKHGEGLIRQIYEAIDLGDYEHQVVAI
jgi:bacillithiol biosynthesis cysteine-adding enzyme BshC